MPAELNYDEIDLYNSAYSIVHTGHDVDGRLLPFLYSPYSRNPPIYAIASYASAQVFGKTAFGLRFPAVLFGLAAIVLLYAIAFELTRRREIALIAALLAAVQPIFVHFSRVGWEPAAELPFLLGGFYLLLRWRGDVESALWAALVLGAASYAYMAAWFYAALLGGVLLVLRAGSLRSRTAWAAVPAAAFAWLLVSWPALVMLFAEPVTRGRAQRIFTFSGGVTPQTLTAFAHNYAVHFSAQFLVLTGVPQSGTTWRYLNGFGAFFWWVLPFAALGVAFSQSLVRDRAARWWLLLWLAAYPLGGALTNEGVPNAPRTLAGAPIFCVYAALGAWGLYRDVRAWHPRAAWLGGLRNAAPVIAAALALFSVLHFAIFYFTRYVHVNSNAWDSGTAAMFARVRTLSAGFQRVCFSVRPAWYELPTYERFYLAGDPIQTFNDVNDPACFAPGTLIVTDTDHPLDRRGFHRVARIFDVDGNPFTDIDVRPSG